MIRNREVKRALDHCIDKRWRLLAQGETLYNVSKCALCELFGGGNERAGYRFKPNSKCKGCPIYLRNGGKGCATGSLFDQYMNTFSAKSAQAMLRFLRDTRKHFFGDVK